MKISKLFLVSVVLLASCVAYAKFDSMKNRNEFEKDTSRAQFAVALFYDASKEARKDEQLGHKIKGLERMFKDASRNQDYKDAGVLFASSNISRRDLDSVAQKYNITQLPSILLLRYGSLVRNKETKQLVMLTGFVTRNDLEMFIKNHFGKEIRKEARETRKRREANRAYWSVGFGYGYPYWGYGYPYYRGYWW
jgi:hypothetical protein